MAVAEDGCFFTLQNQIHLTGPQLTTAETALGPDSYIRHLYDSGEGRETIVVPCVALDDYVEKGKRVDLVKIDTQGYEWNVLRGMNETNTPGEREDRFIA